MLTSTSSPVIETTMMVAGQTPSRTKEHDGRDGTGDLQIASECRSGRLRSSFFGPIIHHCAYVFA